MWSGLLSRFNVPQPFDEIVFFSSGYINRTPITHDENDEYQATSEYHAPCDRVWFAGSARCADSETVRSEHFLRFPIRIQLIQHVYVGCLSSIAFYELRGRAEFVRQLRNRVHPF